VLLTGLLGDLREEALVDLDRVNATTRSDRFGEWNAEQPGAGAKIGDDLTGLQRDACDDLVDLEVVDARRLLERLLPFLRRTGRQLCVNSCRRAEYQHAGDRVRKA
jgi:hypothetical protein